MKTKVRKNAAAGHGVKRNIMWKRLPLLAAVSIILIMSLIQPGYAKTTAEKLQDAKNEKAQKEQELQETKGKISALENNKSALVGYLTDLNADLSKVADKLDKIENQLADKEDELANTESDIDELNELIEVTKQELEAATEDMNSHYEFMKKRIRHIYEQGEADYTELLFGVKSFGDMLNYAEYMEKATEYDQTMLKKLKDRRKEIKEKKKQIEDAVEKLEEKYDKMQKEKAEIEDLHADARAQQGMVQGLVTKTTNGIASYSGQIESAEKQAEAYEVQIAAKEQDIKQLEIELEKERELARRSASMAKKDLSQISVADGERELLACLIHCEAAGEPYEGQIAVGAVVMNRCMSGAFPDTITGVIYQSGQFAPVASGRLAARLPQGASASCYRAADEVLSGANNIGDCLFFRTIIPQIKGKIIGNHVFYNP